MEEGFGGPAYFGEIEETSVPQMIDLILKEDAPQMLADLNNETVLTKIRDFLEENEKHGAREADHRQAIETFAKLVSEAREGWRE